MALLPYQETPPHILFKHDSRRSTNTDLSYIFGYISSHDFRGSITLSTFEKSKAGHEESKQNLTCSTDSQGDVSISPDFRGMLLAMAANRGFAESHSSPRELVDQSRNK